MHEMRKNRSVLHFAGGQKLGVMQDVEHVREAIFDRVFSTEHVTLVALEVAHPAADEEVQVLVNFANVAYVYPTGE